ncbi:(2Fe-2S)-binding protein [Luteimonas vadosa]|uniref:Bacterioferritin-associated ferredoxin n=1 Tax=Luteimonas vadosa TaxID=1165507 RepID=A0ABP9DU76_9GAMM
MYVCVCNGVTESDIRHSARAGCRGMAELTMRTGCGATCGSCLPMACELLEQARADHAAEGTRVAFPGVAHAA